MQLIALLGRVGGPFLRRLLRRLLPESPPCAYLAPSGETFPLEPPRWCAEAAGGGKAPLMLTPLPGIGRHQIDASLRSIWRYAAAFPLTCHDPITLGEGCTPLLARHVGGGATVHFKCEWFNPTCSFKDRGTSVMLSLLRQQGVSEVLEDSSGNGGASVAAYAAAGGMKATIMAPASTSPAKTVQMAAHGASVGVRQLTKLSPRASLTQPRPPVSSHGVSHPNTKRNLYATAPSFSSQSWCPALARRPPRPRWLRTAGAAETCSTPPTTGTPSSSRCCFEAICVAPLGASSSHSPPLATPVVTLFPAPPRRSGFA